MRLGDIVGQQAVVSRLGVVLKAYRQLREPLDHILFSGGPGIGKKTFAKVLATEIDAELQEITGSALKDKNLLAFLTNINEGSIQLIEEIHLIPPSVMNQLIPVMENFSVNMLLGEGINARTIPMKLKRFTLIGTTTRIDLLDYRIRHRFHMHERLESYSIDELIRMVTIHAGMLQTIISPEAATEIARRSSKTPQKAIESLSWVRQYAIGEANTNGIITFSIAEAAMKMAPANLSE